MVAEEPRDATTAAGLPARVLAAWDIAGDSVRPLGAGLINRTFLAATTRGEPRVLQQVNPIFPPEVNSDIEQVTAHLAERGLETPRIVTTLAGARWLEAEDGGGTWRALTYVAGRSMNALTSPAQAHAAGELLGRFHRALDDYDHAFASRRPPIHDLGRHLAALEAALGAHGGHRDYDQVAPLAEAIFAAARRLDPLAATPPRVVHGDPKINNILFRVHADEALCLVDLDTLGRMDLPLELGDALRSWCNPAGEDRRQGIFSVALFRAAVSGYARAAAGWVGADEVAGIVAATASIQVELAARFCADALNERYFGWDPAQFPTRGEHNRARAEGQLAIHRSLLAERPALEKAVSAAFRAA